MSTHRVMLWVLLSVVGGIGLGYGGYNLYQKYVSFSQTIVQDRLRAQDILANRARTSNALESAGVSSLQASRGFWYTYTDQYGNQSVFYFDPDKWALQQGLTDAQIADLIQALASSTVVDREAMRDVPESDLPPELQFNNALYTRSTAEGFTETLSAFEKKYTDESATSDELWKLSYMYELRGEYAKRDAVNKENCTKYKARCASSIAINVRGTVVDLEKRPISGARVSVLSKPDVKPVVTDEKGTYTFKVSVRSMEKLRVSAVKRNFSEGVVSALVVNAGIRDYAMEPIVLGSPISIVTIDTLRRTVTDSADEAREDGSFVIRARSSAYVIPPRAIVRADGTPYKGAVDVYLYEFTRDTVPESLVTIDTFDQVIGYAGNLMLSFGMPYIQFFTPEGEELHVLKSNPMILTYRLAGMTELQENADNLPAGPLTELDLRTLVNASAGESGFPITYGFLAMNKLLTFPPFWVFDRKKGVWENVGMRVLDMQGTIQAPFYTINNN